MRGFTLLEMLIVVALLGVLAAMSAVAVTPLATRYRVGQGTELALQTLYQARAQARELSRCHQVEVMLVGVPVAPGVAGDSLRIRRRVDADCETPIAAEPPPSPALEVVETVNMPQGISVTVPALLVPPVWRSNGRLTPNAETQLLITTTAAAPIQSTSRVVRALPQGPICVSANVVPLEACP